LIESRNSDILYGVLSRPRCVSVIAGEPGTGKTLLALKLVSRLAKEGRKCIIYSFNEDEGSMRERLEKVYGTKDENIVIREGISLSGEGLSMMLSDMLSDIKGASLIIVDSIEALSVGMKSDQERRALLQSIYKTVKGSDSSVIIISESGDPFVLTGYAADAYVTLYRESAEERVYRYAYIRKVRDLSIINPYVTFSTYDGFTEISYMREFLTLPTIKLRPSKFIDLIMTGVRSIVEFSNDIPYSWVNYMKRSIVAHLLERGHGVMYFTSYDEDEQEVKETVKDLLVEKKYLRNLVVSARREEEVGEDLAGYWLNFFKKRAEIAKMLKGKTGKTPISVFSMWFNDLVYSKIGVEHVKILQQSMRMDKRNGVKSIGFTTSGVKVNELERNMADTYFRAVLKHGRVLLYGEKPFTELMGIRIVEEDGLKYEFVPLV
jgi:KaiC/GvpD/RAD55 family RecA-like ATPase